MSNRGDLERRPAAVSRVGGRSADVVSRIHGDDGGTAPALPGETLIGDGFLPHAEGFQAALALDGAVGDGDRSGRLRRFRSVAYVETLETFDHEIRRGDIAARRETRLHAAMTGPDWLYELVRHGRKNERKAEKDPCVFVRD